jgi:predicted dehydrogenase
MAITITNRVNGHSGPKLRVGIVGCGEIAQVVHIPTLNHLREKYEITYLCDVSPQALENCVARSSSKNVKTTANVEELVASSDVDVVLVANATPFHAPHAVLALQHDKHVLLEKPASLTYRDIDAVIEAEKLSKGKVLVGTMRRYAPAFVEAVAEIGGVDQISHVRVRDVIGPNSDFVNQSGTFPKVFKDIPEIASKELANRNAENIQQALVEEFEVRNTPENSLMLQLLAGWVPCSLRP